MTIPLAHIPLIDAPDGPVQLARLQAAKLKYLLRVTHEIVPAPLLRWADRHSEQWLRRCASPYVAEISEIAALLGEHGSYALNLNFEWGCTTACRANHGEAPGIYRTLDWPFRLGADVVVARHRTNAGHYYNITWPGYVGVLTAIAPQRFAAAINQAPMIYTFAGFGLGLPVDWVVNRWRVRRETAVPPAHLLRTVFDTRGSYEEAKRVLASTPICIPVLFTLAGAQPGESCIIERRERDAFVHEGSGTVANHWINPHFKGRARPIRSHDRRAKLAELLSSLEGDLDWLVAPVLNAHTRLAVELNAGQETLLVQGWHGHEPRTHVFKLGPGLP
jgi:hypothetical protein